MREWNRKGSECWLARTIADLAGTERVELEHLDEAVGYRMSDPLQAVA